MSSKSLPLPVRRNLAGISILGLLAAAFLIMSGCGGGSNSTPPGTNPGPSAMSAAQIKMGDAPADRVVSFEVTAGPITLTPTSGATVTALSGSRRLELTHLSGTSEPLVLLNLPQGSYTSASLTVSSPEVTFINNLGALVKLQPALNQIITVNFSPALNVGSSSSVINIDLNVASSLTFDASGNVTAVNLSSSSFSFSTAAIAAGNNQNSDDGELEDTTGMVTGVSGTSFTMNVGQNSVALTFTTDTNTQFSDGASLATMANTIVKVEGITNSDGSLYAKEVEGIENSSGAELEGLVTHVSGSPASQLNVVAQDGIGNGVDDTVVGSSLVANVTGAQYKVNKGNIDTSGIGGLPSPPTFAFDASTVHAGQRVEVESIGAVAGGAVTAEKVKLQQQGLNGTVSGLAGPTTAGPVTFTLTVPSDSAFAMLSGTTTLTVFWQPGTDLHNLASVSNGDSVRVRGLVFFTGSSFNMIARRIDR